MVRSVVRSGDGCAMNTETSEKADLTAVFLKCCIAAWLVAVAGWGWSAAGGVGVVVAVVLGVVLLPVPLTAAVAVIAVGAFAAGFCDTVQSALRQGRLKPSPVRSPR